MLKFVDSPQTFFYFHVLKKKKKKSIKVIKADGEGVLKLQSQTSEIWKNSNEAFPIPHEMDPPHQRLTHAMRKKDLN